MQSVSTSSDLQHLSHHLSTLLALCDVADSKFVFAETTNQELGKHESRCNLVIIVSRLSSSWNSTVPDFNVFQGLLRLIRPRFTSVRSSTLILLRNVSVVLDQVRLNKSVKIAGNLPRYLETIFNSDPNSARNCLVLASLIDFHQSVFHHFISCNTPSPSSNVLTAFHQFSAISSPLSSRPTQTPFFSPPSSTIFHFIAATILLCALLPPVYDPTITLASRRRQQTLPQSFDSRVSKSSIFRSSPVKFSFRIISTCIDVQRTYRSRCVASRSGASETDCRDW